MLHLAIPQSQRAELNHVLRGGEGHVRGRGRALVLDTRHRVISDLSDWLLDGQVEWDTSALVDRTATATILDPDGRAGLDSATVLESSIRVDRYLQLLRDIWLPTAQEWVSIPLFTGPVCGVDRDGDVITVAAQGKESIARQPFMRPLAWSKGTPRVTVIRDMLAKGTGETFLNLPTSLSGRLGKQFSVARMFEDEERTIWGRSRQQARALGAQLYYDARGIAKLRKRPIRVLWSFTEEHVAGRVKVTEDVSQIINTVNVLGGVPKGGSKPVSVTRSLPDGHPWSPKSLGRGGVRRYLPERVEDTELVTVKDALALAERRLREHETSSVDIEVNVLPVPMLEPDDLYRVDAGDVSSLARAHRATISVTGGLMSLGTVRVYRPRTWRRR